MDSYQAIYDAVRSRISCGDISHVVEQVLYNVIKFDMAQYEFQVTAWNISSEMTRPSVMFRPVIYQDGNMICALYGENIQDGVAGFGKTADEACKDFDKNWKEQQVRWEG